MQVQFDGGILEHMDAAASARAFLLLLTALVQCNLVWFREHPDTPHPYQAGVRYLKEPRGQEHWKGIAKILRDRHGDCEDLAAYLAAWYLARGHRGVAVVLQWKRLENGAHLFHVVVRNPQGQLEDPSERLGMKDGGTSR